MIKYLKTCSRCQKDKPTSDFNKRNASKDGLMSKCRDCQKEYRLVNIEKETKYKKAYYQSTKTKQQEYAKAYYQTNMDWRKRYDKAYHQSNKENNKARQRARYANDELYACSRRIRSRINESLRKNGYSKKSRTYEILGCSFEEFKSHIESQFIDGMSWDNRDKWHIDHIKPISRGKTEEEIIALNHYTNLQPLWAIDNWSKSDKYEE